MEDAKKNWINPFSIDRVEGWRVEEQPENYKKIADLFAPPDFMDKLEDPAVTKAIFIIGGRGCGKSHILRRMAIQSEIEALETKYGRKFKSAEFDKQYFGIYLKSDCFSPLSKESITYLNNEQLEALFEHYFNVEVSKSILEGVRFLISHLESTAHIDELAICNKILDYLKHLKWTYDSISSFSELLYCLDDQVKGIVTLIKNILFEPERRKYLDVIHLTQTPEFILNIYDIIRNEIGLLKNKPLILLLDEYESLDENQQRLINQIIKGRRLTLRIAVKVRGVKTLNTKTSERLDELHDYDHIDLHFKLDNENRPKYKLLTRQVFENRLSLKDEYGIYKVRDPKKLLPSSTLKDEGITEEDIQIELRKFKDSLKKNKEIKNQTTYWKNFQGHYNEAAIFRILREKGKDKSYAGFEEYVSLSSGIIRLFIWLCREAFAIAKQEAIEVMDGEAIRADLQSRAAVKVANNELNITIPQTINNLYASKLAYFINDIGQILRTKLHYSAQPQANRIEIIDPEKFDSSDYSIPRELIESGQDLPVLISESPFKPRDVKYPFPKTFSLNGIFSPLFNIPPESRWRTEIKADELKSLCLSEQRSETLEKIVNQIKKKERLIRKKIKVSKDTTTPDIFKSILQPITLANCPVTGKGCDRNLLLYDASSLSSVHAFLALPFNEGWISDPRRWIKDALLECGNVICKDVDDFPSQKFILCKICSCVRQYPFGLFEITDLNPNVIFELGMSTGLNKTTFFLVFKEKIPSHYRDNFPPPPLNNIEYIPYELSSAAILKKIKEKVKPAIDVSTEENFKCKIIDSKCPQRDTATIDKNVFVGFPQKKGDQFFEEVYKSVTNILKPYGFSPKKYNPAKSLTELCQICKGIRDAHICIIDTTYNDITMLLALGIAFSKDKQFVQLHNTELGGERPISDLRAWAIEYKNILDLEKSLEEELPKRLQ